ncbi:MAG: aminopeptidase N, partial [Succinivibrio sp.]|nr:aminopeptidase N [Succinivibrio sp.]
MENKNNFKVMKRSDYKAPAYTALNADLTFDLSDDRTIVKSKVTYRRLLTDSRPSLILNTEESEIVSVKINDVSVDISSNSFVNNLKKNIIELQTPNESEFVVEIENIINPQENTSLMGLYKSNGTFCTQCEPEGFRRITPFLDRSDVLAKYRVTIIAPVYGCGVLLSNGNLVEKGTKDGRQFAVWEDPFPKPSYLFAMVAGTFDILKDTYVTMSGRKVSLELYVDRGSYERGLWAMQSIKDSMKWDEDRWGLEYDLDNFKVVAVDFFNFG